MVIWSRSVKTAAIYYRRMMNMSEGYPTGYKQNIGTEWDDRDGINDSHNPGYKNPSIDRLKKTLGFGKKDTKKYDTKD